MTAADAHAPGDVPVVEFREVQFSVPRASDIAPVAGNSATAGGEPAAILRDFSLRVPRGATLVLLGRSGSGKTTALKLVNRLLEPTRGDVLVDGKSTRDWDAIRLRRRTGYVIQEAGLLPHFTVAQNVGLLPRLEDWPPERIRNRVDELLELVGLPPEQFRARFPRELSGGQRQRVGVARALAADPPLLLMDEPFGALDPITRAEIQTEFLALQRRLGKTVLLVTHDLHEALRLGSHIALLDAGRLAALCAAREFLSSENPAVREYVRAFDLRSAASPVNSGDSP